MAFRLKLVPQHTKIDFFKFGGVPAYITMALAVLSVVSVFVLGLNFGIDFKGGTTIRTESTQNVAIADYRAALDGIGLEDLTITEVFDTNFRADQFVKQVRVAASEDSEANTATVEAARTALVAIDPTVKFVAVETVGPKVSGELVQTAVLALAAALVGIMLYVWVRFEWQFGVAACIALLHDALLTMGLFSVFQVKFDLTIVAALLTIIGFSINDTVVIFDRVREILRKDSQTPLKALLNVALNETLSRTVMTTLTTVLALLALYIWGGDVIRGFAFAMIFGAFVGVFSTIFVASQIVLWLGVKRDWSKKEADGPKGTQFPTDA